MTASSHTLDVRLDAKGLVANAGLVLPTTLAQRLGLPELIRQHVQLGNVLSAANPDRKAMTAIASLLEGGEHVDDINVLRTGGASAEILGVVPAAASTVGTFLGPSRRATRGNWMRCRRTSTSGLGQQGLGRSRRP